MRKIICLIISLLLILSLVACGNDSGKNDDPLRRGDDGTTPSTNQGGNGQGGNEQGGVTPGDVNLGSILSGDSTNIIWANTDAATKAELKRQAEEEGFTIEFGADGTTTMTDSSGVYKQLANGAWEYHSADGQEAIVYGTWVENEFTALVPKPNLAVSSTNVEEDGCSVWFKGASKDDIKAYAQSLSAAGFNVDPETNEGEVFGVDSYSYEAYNSNGCYVVVNWSANMSILSIYPSNSD